MFFVQTIDCFVSSSIFFPGQVNIIWQQKSEDRLMVVVRFWLHLPPFPIHMCSLLKYHQQSPHLQTSFNKCLLPVPYVGYICFLPRDEEWTVIKYLLGILGSCHPRNTSEIYYMNFITINMNASTFQIWSTCKMCYIFGV